MNTERVIVKEETIIYVDLGWIERSMNGEIKVRESTLKVKSVYGELMRQGISRGKVRGGDSMMRKFWI